MLAFRPSPSPGRQNYFGVIKNRRSSYHLHVPSVNRDSDDRHPDCSGDGTTIER